MLLTTLRTAITTDRLTTETISQERSDRLIASAVREYSRYAPIKSSTTITTVADQEEYDLSDLNCLWVLECQWWPAGQLFAELRSGAEQVYIPSEPSRYHMPSERVINDINQSALIKAMRGTWEQRNQTLVVFPTPSVASSESLEIVYAALHVLNDAETGYDTIPDEDLDIVADLATAVYLQASMSERALESDYAEGLQRVTAHFIPANLRQTIKELRQGVKDKNGGTGVGVLR